MKKKKILAAGIMLALSASMFVSCLDDDNQNDNIIYFYDEPAIVLANGTTTSIRTQYGDLLAPQMNGKGNSGEYYFLNFYMDKTIQPYTAFNIFGQKMGADTVNVFSGRIDDDYTAPILDVKLYLQDPNVNFLRSPGNEVPTQTFLYVDSTFFIRPFFDGPEQAYDFELLAPKDSIDKGNGYPNLYLRAKKSTNDYSKFAYALNLSSLIKQPQYVGKKEVKFNLKFKSGGTLENDIYSDYKNNPVSITFSK